MGSPILRISDTTQYTYSTSDNHTLTFAAASKKRSFKEVTIKVPKQWHCFFFSKKIKATTKGTRNRVPTASIDNRG